MSALEHVTGTGVSLWLDGLDRAQLVGGEFARLVRDGSITGTTTHPATPRAAMLRDPEDFATELADYRARGVDAGTARCALAATDVRLISRVDVEMDRQMVGDPAAEAVHGRVALANARLAHRLFAQSLHLPRWFALAAAGARRSVFSGRR